jgi:phage terminase small subunit
LSDQDHQNTPAFADLYEALDPKERRFVDEYLECLNAALAARRVWGHKAARQQGYVVLRRPDVAAAVEAGLREQRERTNNDPDRILRELMLIAFADPGDFVDATGKLLPLSRLPQEIRRVIASVEYDKDSVTTGKGKSKRTRRVTVVKRYKLAAKTAALELLGKRLKMWTDRVELDASEKLSALIEQAYNRPRPAESAK